ncbi:MAG: hypothetical protein JXR37_26710 [Kiritimatiellae bacterium]|nr:hypothetical protein [Kiritimatiellia bacterium]
MKIRLSVLALLLVLLTACSREKGPQPQTHAILPELIGTWVAGEMMMPQPPRSMWQQMKSISFSTNGIVTWSCIGSGGKMEELTGRFEILEGNPDSGGRPALFVGPTNGVDPLTSRVRILWLGDLEVDFDSRFHPEKVGKVLKAENKNGGRLVFLRVKQGTANQPLHGTRGDARP